MPKIDLCFSGWVRGANIQTVTLLDPTQMVDGFFKKVNVRNWSAERLLKALQSGEVSISLVNTLNNGGDDEEIEIFDYEETK